MEDKKDITIEQYDSNGFDTILELCSLIKSNKLS